MVNFDFVVAAGHPLAAAPEPLSSEDILRHRAVSAADSSRVLPARTSGLLIGQDVLSVPDQPSKLEAHCLGLGVGYLPSYIAAPAVAAGRLKIKRVAEGKPPVQVALAWRSESAGRALEWFVARFKEPRSLGDLFGAEPALMVAD
jgi:DNA-binding transcriptional LysR family regulator